MRRAVNNGRRPAEAWVKRLRRRFCALDEEYRELWDRARVLSPAWLVWLSMFAGAASLHAEAR